MGPRETTITSPHNAKVKLAQSLKVRKYREQTGLLLVEGERMVRQALAFGAAPEYILLEARWRDSALHRELVDRGVDVFFVDARLLDRVSSAESPSGVAGVFAKGRRSVPEKATWLLVLDRWQDPGNVGTAMRAAVAVGVDGVLLTHGTVDPTNPKALRASAGAYFGLPVEVNYCPEQLQAACRRRGLAVVAADVHAETDAFSFDWTRPHALIMGSEGHGIDPRISAEIRVRLPMPGGIESLNAAMATTLLLYEAWRRRCNT